jgi:hypothetical protein
MATPIRWRVRAKCSTGRSGRFGDQVLEALVEDLFASSGLVQTGDGGT